MAAPNMNLTLPVVTVTIGPEWATELNTALEVIDSHDHSSDKGVSITPAGLDISTNLDIQNHIFYNFQAVRFQAQTAALTGASNANALHSVSGDLYFTNSAGTAVQLTAGGSIVASPGSASVFTQTAISTDATIGAGDTYVTLLVDTTSARTLTLPLASGVAAGRVYIIKDVSGQSEANNITLGIAGSDTIDGAASIVLSSNYGSWMISGDSVTSWYVL